MPPGPVVGPADPADHPAACRVLFAHLPEPYRSRRAARALELLSSGEFDPAGLLVAQESGRVVGAALTQFHPGSAAVAWPPGAEAGPGHEAVIAALTHAVADRLRAAGVKQVQILLPPADRDRARPLEAIGFRHVTRLTFLCRPVSPGTVPGERSRLRFAPATGPVFSDTLFATYDGTLDCPELNGTRTPDEVLAGYRSAAAEPPDWWLVSAGSGPAGVLLMAPGPRPGVAELSYLGLVPSARGRGLGREVVWFALARAAASAAEWLTLSADVRNEPALRMYRAQGFREYDLQDVFLWQPNR
jgi:GNAT superfamily N-acetyltransferase